ncbi:hypothetical protein Gotur_029609 [Gossypium turneri]
MMAILVQTGLEKVITGKKPENLNKIEWEELDLNALYAIQLPHEYGIIGGIDGEDLIHLVEKVRNSFATKSLANCLVLKQRLFTFHVNEGELLRYHISQFITLLNDLKKSEVHIDDED